jgi:hypothetical protein
MYKIISNLQLQGIAELANGSEKSRYTFLEISDPATLLIKGENLHCSSAVFLQ